MGLQPKIPKKKIILKTCEWCNGQFSSDNFSPAKSDFFLDGYFPICNSCIKQYLRDHDFSWEAINKLCRYGNIPFIPEQFENTRKESGDDAFSLYAAIFKDKEFDDLDWNDYFQKFKELRDNGEIENVLPELREEKYYKLRKKFGANYDDDALDYLDNLYKGVLSTQNINGNLQEDQALKICKISYEIDNRIRAGEDFDKLLASYEKLVKVGNFTPKNVKNANDFDTVGELILWLEKRGWKNDYYNNVSKDIVDETIKNIQAWNQRCYTNENSIGEEINRRLEALKYAQQQENYYDLNKKYDLDSYENDGYEELIKEDFSADIG